MNHDLSALPETCYKKRFFAALGRLPSLLLRLRSGSAPVVELVETLSLPIYKKRKILKPFF